MVAGFGRLTQNRVKRLLSGMIVAGFFVLGMAVRDCAAELHIHALFRDHMVLQRDMPVPVWGWSRPGDRIEVTFAGQRKSAIADSNGRWQITLSPMLASTISREMVITEADGSAKQTLKDILVGEVWLCAGQSNMLAMTLSLSTGTKMIRNSNNREIRLYRVDVRSAQKPQEHFLRGSLGAMLPVEKEALDNTALRWQIADPASVATFSGVGYSFGRLLQADLGVPVGIVEAAFGGTTGEQWTPRTALLQSPELAPLVNDFKGYVTDPNYPGGLYNGSIAPLQPMAFRGVLWYQGESNSDTYPRALQYRMLLHSLVTSWRKAWQRDVPFLVVQIACFHDMLPQPSDDPLAWLRESQAIAVRELPNTALGVAIDIGLANNWHPANKAVIGRRIEAAALKMVYGRDVIDAGPKLANVQRNEGSIILRFRNVGEGLIAQDVVMNDGKYHVGAEYLKGFAVAGPDHRFHWASAQILGKDHVELSAPDVPHPVDVRYGWAAFPLANLANTEGFPAAPFRTDDFPPEPLVESR